MKQQELFEQLDRLGVRTQEALERFMGNEALYLSFVCKLPEKLDFARIQNSLEEEDEETFYLHVHDLKGMAGNLSMTPIYDCAQAILVEFHTSRFKNKKKLKALLQEAETQSRTLSALIAQYLSEEREV